MKHNKTENRVVLVTGGSRGIGRAIAITLAKDGYDVVVNYRANRRTAIEVVGLIRRLGRKAWAIRADVGRERQVERLFREIQRRVGRLDVVVNNAGYDYAKLIEEYSMREMRRVVDILLIARMQITKLALPLLKQSTEANIVHITSRMGKEKTIATIGAYGPAEAGIMKFAQCCALEFAPYKIRVNCVAPGMTKTELAIQTYGQKVIGAAARGNPSGRIAEPKDIANVVSFLVSDKASYINGETIGVNGGSNLG